MTKEPRLKKLSVFEISFHGKKLTRDLGRAFQDLELFLELYAHKFAENHGIFCEVGSRHHGRHRQGKADSRRD